MCGNKLYLYTTFLERHQYTSNRINKEKLDGVLWLKFVAKGASGIQNVNSYNNPQQGRCYDFISKEAVFEMIALIYILA